MNRRECLRFLLVGAVIASPSVALVAPRVLDHLTLHEIVMRAIRLHAKEIAANVSRDNAILRVLKQNGYRRPALLSTLDGYPVRVEITAADIMRAANGQ